MEVWIPPGGLEQLIQKASVFRPPVGIKQVDLIRRLVVRGLTNHAKERRDADATGQEHCWLFGFLRQNERTAGPLNFYFEAEGGVAKHALEGCVPHAGRDH